MEVELWKRANESEVLGQRTENREQRTAEMRRDGAKVNQQG